MTPLYSEDINEIAPLDSSPENVVQPASLYSTPFPQQQSRPQSQQEGYHSPPLISRDISQVTDTDQIVVYTAGPTCQAVPNAQAYWPPHGMCVCCVYVPFPYLT